MSMRAIEESIVGPPPGSVPATTVPLTFLDLHWMVSRPAQLLFFYDFSFSTLEFTSQTLPALKTSLSLALHRFFPLAGRIVFSPHHKPHLLYVEGCSVPFTAFECHMHFAHLTGDHAQSLGDLKALVPSSLPPVRERDGTSVTEQPVLAVQVTVFPNSGISIGVTFSHVAADGKSLSHFIKYWAAMYRLRRCGTSCSGDRDDLDLPEHCRDSISDPNDVASIFIKESWQITNMVSSSSLELEKIRVTFVINQSQIERLKDWIRKKHEQEEEEKSSSEPLRISTFAVASALMWSCLVKSQQINACGFSDPICHFLFTADCREKLKLPASFFGNCIAPLFAAARRSVLIGEKGVIEGAKAIGGEIRDFEKSGAIRGAEKWISVSREIFEAGQVTLISGSPKLKVYDTDFGWGRARRERLFIFHFPAPCLLQRTSRSLAVEWNSDWCSLLINAIFFVLFLNKPF